MSLRTELTQMLRPYYWFNLLLSVSYVAAKRTPYLCTIMFPGAECELDGREVEILFFLMVVVALRTRKAGSLTMLNYMSSAFVYAKIANLILWFYADVRMGLVFGAVLVLCGLLLPEPTYQGPENLVYFRGLQNLEESMTADGAATWLVCLYAAWHPACVNFAPVFSKLSHEYHLKNLRFGKIDVGRYPEAAAKYRVVDGPTSRQLPSLLLLEGAKEKTRRPQADSSGKLVKFLFTEENVKTHFDLPGLHQVCRDKLNVHDSKKAQ